MYLLRLLGGAVLEGPEGPVGGRAGQRRHLALLAVLALARVPVSRDKLVALFWPEHPADQGRQYLATALYVLRRALGAGALLSAGDDVSLNASVIASDVARFQAAADAGAWGDAAGAYAGPFLDGVSAGSSVELERWIEGERQRLEGLFHTALERRAAEAERQGDLAGAAATWGRRAAADPLSGRVALAYMAALERAGDHAGALRHARVHERLLREELDAPPDPAVAALAARLRDRPEPAVAVPAARAVELPPPRSDAADDAGAGAPAAAPAAAPERAPATSPGGRARPNPLLWRVPAGAGVAALALAALLAAPRHGSTPHTRPSPVASPSIAVLYLENASADTIDRYLSDGITEEVAAGLGKIPWLRVKSPGAVRRVQGERVTDPAMIGRQLGVRYVVEGSVRRQQRQVRVTVRLTDAATGFQLWTDAYDAQLPQLIPLEETIAGRIVEKVGGRLFPWDRSLLAHRAVTNPDAYDHFLRGNYHLNKRTPREVLRAIGEYEQAARLDPAFTDPLVRMAYAYALFVDWGWSYPGKRPPELLRLGHETVARALAADTASAEAWLACALLLVEDDPRKLSGATPAFEHALALNPRDAEAHFQYGQTLMILDRFDDAAAEYHRALALEPERAMTYVPLAAIAYDERHFDGALALADSAVAADPGVPYAYAVRGLFRLGLGNMHGARDDGATALAIDPSYPVPARAVLAGALARLGDTAAARAQLEQALHAIDPRHPSSTDVLFLNAAQMELGRVDDAVALAGAVQPPTAWLHFYLGNPQLARLQRDRRYARIVQRAMAHPDPAARPGLRCEAPGPGR